jgi:hypothetical protein
VIPADTIRALTLEVPDSPAALERENGATLERVTPDPTPRQTTRGDSGHRDYGIPAPVVASARRVVHRLSAVRSRPVEALEALAWDLSLLATDPATPASVAEQLAALLEQAADTVDPLGDHR